MLTGYTFFVDDGVTETEVFPRVNTLVFNDTPDDTNKFYRKVLQTRMIFAGDDYTLLKAEEDAATCSVWDFIIKYQTAEVFRGFIRFNTSSIAEIDVSNCRINVKVQSSDDYTCFLRAWDDEINIFIGTSTNAVLTHYGTIECETCIDIIAEPSYPLLSVPFAECSPALDDADGWTITSNVADSVFPDEVEPPPIGLTTIYCRQFVDDASHVAEPPGDGWINVTGGWARTITATMDLATSALTPNGANELIQAFFTPGLDLTDEDAPVINTIDNGVLLNDILETFIPCSLTVVSDFFNINPDATAPANTPYTYADENLQNIIVWQKSDVKRPGASNNATNGKWNFKSLLTQLRVLFNVRFRVVGTDFRIEHVSYFEDATSNGEDLATDHPDRILGKHSYQIDDAKVPKSERWQFMEAVSEAFTGEPITYTCFSDESKAEDTFVADRVNCDIPELTNSPDSYQDDGFVFGACHEDGGTYYLITSENPLDSTLYLNGPLCIPNLLANLHTYERPLISGTLNGAPTTFDSAIRRKRQTALVIPFGAADYFAWNPADLVNTQMGWGEVDNASWNAATCQLTLNVNH
jgi:hypothetical protein